MQCSRRAGNFVCSGSMYMALLARGEATQQSDVDFLVEFDEPDLSPAKRFFGLLHRLEDTLECDVDLLTIGSLRNPYFRKRVMSERVSLYEG